MLVCAKAGVRGAEEVDGNDERSRFGSSVWDARV